MTRIDVVCHKCGASTSVGVEFDPPLVYTIPQVAALLKVRQASVYELVESGDIPAVRVWSGGQRVVPRIGLEAYLDRLLPEAGRRP